MEASLDGAQEMELLQKFMFDNFLNFVNFFSSSCLSQGVEAGQYSLHIFLRMKL